MARTCVSSIISHPGIVATTNDDCAYASDARGTYIVSDGVGSCRHAARASRLAVEVASGELKHSPSPDLRQTLSWAVREANRRVQEEGLRAVPHEVLAATISILQIRGEAFFTAHVGDSRIYLLRDGRLSQITKDHSLAYEQYRKGAITRDDLRHHPNLNVLTRTLGTTDCVAPDFTDGPVDFGDRFLLCSDGLTKELSDDRIAGILAEESETEDACHALVGAANDAGGRDNTTVVVVEVR